MASELLVLLSLIISYNIYNSFIRPIELMKSGVNAIVEEDFNVRFVKTKSAEMNELISVFNTMLERLRQEGVRTQQQAYFLESLIDASPIGMIILDYDGLISVVNPMARSYLDIDDHFAGQELRWYVHPLAARIDEMPSGTDTIVQTDAIRRYRCQVTQVIHKGFHRRFIIIEELSKELLKSEKMAYGKVIRMMAHEVNNSMGAVNSILQTVLDYGLDREEDKDMADSLVIAHDRNAALAQFVKNLADVVRLPEPFLQEVDLKELCHHCAMIMKPQLSERNISLAVSGLPHLVDIDGVQIQQVVLNVVKNAMESISMNGTIECIISKTQPQLVVVDNGPGISDEVAQELFTPFYSTKPAGQGIGLMMSREILLNHEATFSLNTDEESGLTRFEISF